MRENVTVYECEKCGYTLIEKSFKIINIDGEYVVKSICDSCEKILIRQKNIVDYESV